ncbi:hypothetical protein MNBD_GAMMA23-2056 [hydrothermal vent metagenome]|uniref:Cytochrome c domain-containing protein n=1 Tax=hydrothermal vent metagenome TaxID=652676 RepID=A0A3B0ZP19_9ZZZZ
MKTSLTAFIISLLAWPASSFAFDTERGEELHDSHCTNCHAAIYGNKGNEIYTRENRKIGSLTELQAQLKRCKNSLGTNWPEDQMLDVQHYLNSNFYHFKE